MNKNRISTNLGRRIADNYQPAQERGREKLLFGENRHINYFGELYILRYDTHGEFSGEAWVVTKKPIEIHTIYRDEPSIDPFKGLDKILADSITIDTPVEPVYHGNGGSFGGGGASDSWDSSSSSDSGGGD